MPNTKRHKYRDWYKDTEETYGFSSPSNLLQHDGGYDPERWERGDDRFQGYESPPFNPHKYDPFLLPLLLVLATLWSCIFVKVGIIDQNGVAFLAFPHVIGWWGFVVWEYFGLDNKENGFFGFR